MRRGLAILGAALAAVLVAFFVSRRGAEDLAARAPAPAKSNVREPVAAPPPQSAPSGSPEGEVARSRRLVDGRPLPASLRGTVPDGALREDAQGDLIVDLSVRRLFDYFLAAAGEEPPDVTRARIVDQMSRLAPKAQLQAVALLERYLAYRDAAREAPGLSSADPAQRFSALKSLRREQLGEQTQRAFFGEEEESAARGLERLRVLSDPNLSPAQRDQRIAQFAKDDPVGRDEAADPPGAGERRAALMRARGAFEGRLAAFRRDSEAIGAASGRTDEQKKAAVERLLESSFEPGERARARAILGARR